MCHKSAAALITLLLVVPSTAEAGTQDLFGFGARGPALGGSFVALARGFESVYYNPAGLTVGTGQAFSFAYQVGLFDLAYKTPRDSVAAKLEDPDPTSGVGFGFDVRLPLGGPLTNRIAFGAGLYVPTKELLSAQLPRPYTPQLWIGGSNARSVAVQAGLAVRILDSIRIGAGIRALAGLNGHINVAPNETGNLGSEVEDQLIVVYSAIVGAIFKPHPQWTIGVVWRDSLAAPFDVPIKADLGDDLPLKVPEITIAGNANYDPMQAALGIAWQPVPSFSVEVGLLWKHWSPMALPIENATTAIPSQPDPNFHDTFVSRIGAEYLTQIGHGMTLMFRSGYAFEPTPVPAQDGAHNFLDPDRHIVSGGLGWGYQSEGARIGVDLYGQVHLLTPTFHEKARREIPGVVGTVNPGFPWIGAKGQLYSFGTSVEIQF